MIVLTPSGPPVTTPANGTADASTSGAAFSALVVQALGDVAGPASPSAAVAATSDPVPGQLVAGGDPLPEPEVPAPLTGMTPPPHLVWAATLPVGPLPGGGVPPGSDPTNPVPGAEGELPDLPFDVANGTGTTRTDVPVPVVVPVAMVAAPPSQRGPQTQTETGTVAVAVGDGVPARPVGAPEPPELPRSPLSARETGATGVAPSDAGGGQPGQAVTTTQPLATQPLATQPPTTQPPTTQPPTTEAAASTDLTALVPAPAPAAPAPAATARDAVATPVAVRAQVFPEVARLVSNGTGTHRVTLELNPAALGEVRVVLTVRRGVVRVSLAASPAAQLALADGAPELRRLLELGGASESRVVVRDLPTVVPADAKAADGTTTPDHGWSAPGQSGSGQVRDESRQANDQHAGTRGGGTAATDGDIGQATPPPIDPDARTRTAGVDVTM